MPATPDEAGAKLLSFGNSLGCFLMLSPKGQLVALEDIRIAADYSKVVPQLCAVNFHVATTVAVRLEPSNLTLVLQARDQANAYFLTQLPGGVDRKPIKVFEDAPEIVANTLENGRFPVIVLEDLQKALVQARSKVGGGPLPVPPIPLAVRYLVMRPSAPKEWLECLKAMFRICAEETDDKTDLLSDRIDELNTRIKRTMVRQYLTDCLWTDPQRKRIGRMASSEDGASFRTFISGAPDLLEFCGALAVSDQGGYDAIEGVANVIPRMVNKMPWTAPTLHIYDEALRKRFGFKEHYSLYAGLRELSVVGAPVLVHRANVLDEVIPVAIIKTVNGAPGMNAAQARSFPIRKVVWNS